MIPESIFSAGIGELFTIRVAGNVMDDNQLGSVEYAADHLGCNLVVVLGHTHCGAVGAAIGGGAGGFIKSAEGVSYAIIISNLVVPLIERYTLPTAFGKEGKK